MADIFNTMHVTAVVNAKVEATAPWGLVHTAEDQAKHGRFSSKEFRHSIWRTSR